jgi:hypothetical protein
MHGGAESGRLMDTYMHQSSVRDDLSYPAGYPPVGAHTHAPNIVCRSQPDQVDDIAYAYAAHQARTASRQPPPPPQHVVDQSAVSTFGGGGTLQRQQQQQSAYSTMQRVCARAYTVSNCVNQMCTQDPMYAGIHSSIDEQQHMVRMAHANSAQRNGSVDHMYTPMTGKPPNGHA